MKLVSIMLTFPCNIYCQYTCACINVYLNNTKYVQILFFIASHDNMKSVLYCIDFLFVIFFLNLFSNAFQYIFMSRIPTCVWMFLDTIYKAFPVLHLCSLYHFIFMVNDNSHKYEYPSFLNNFEYPFF